MSRPPSTNRISDSRRRELRDFCAGGMTLAEIGAHYGVTRERVRHYLLQQGLTTRQQDVRHLPLKRETLALTCHHSLRDCGLYRCPVCHLVGNLADRVGGSRCRKCENLRCAAIQRESAVIRESQARWKAANPDRQRLYRARYQERHREQISARRREQYRLNREAHRDSQRTYYAANRDRILARAHDRYIAKRDLTKI